jgi:DNA-directed RNA polymerase specialized sigma24 family protein
VQIVREAGHVAVSGGRRMRRSFSRDGVPPPCAFARCGTWPIGDDVQGLLPKDASPEQIDAALRAVAAGLRVSPAEEQGPAFAALDDHVGPLLTPRELEVLSAVADGLTNKEIARLLGISLHTVKFHPRSR